MEKSISFNLYNGSDEITLPVLVGLGHSRSHVIALFESLAAEGFGEYRCGSRGRGQYSRFLKNSNCPVEFSIVVDEKTKGRRKSAKPIINASDSINSVIGVEFDELSEDINSGDLVIDNQEYVSEDEDLSVDGEVEDEIPTLMIDADPDLTNVVSSLSVSYEDQGEFERIEEQDYETDLAKRAEEAIFAA